MLQPKPKRKKPSRLDIRVELAPAGGSSLVPGEPNRSSRRSRFKRSRAACPCPPMAAASSISATRPQYGGTSKGVVLETRHSAQVTSPCDGWVVYAGEFRSYGQLLIINAAVGNHVLLAGMSEIDVEPGQFVVAAEPVGTMSGLRARSAGSSSDVTAQVKAQPHRVPLFCT